MSKRRRWNEDQRDAAAVSTFGRCEWRIISGKNSSGNNSSIIGRGPSCRCLSRWANFLMPAIECG